MRRSPYFLLPLLFLCLIGCSRKGDDNPPERLGDLNVQFVVNDQYDLLGTQLTVEMSLYDDSLHAYKIETRQAAATVDVSQTVGFKDINARATFYFLEVKLIADGEEMGVCDDYAVYIQDGAVRQVGLIVLEYDFTGLDCLLQ